MTTAADSIDVDAILATLAALEDDARDAAIAELPDEVLRAIAAGWPELHSLTEDELVTVIALLDQGVPQRDVDGYVARAARRERIDA